MGCHFFFCCNFFYWFNDSIGKRHTISRWCCARNDIKGICLIFRCNLKSNKTFLFEHYRWPLMAGRPTISELKQSLYDVMRMVRLHKEEDATFKFQMCALWIMESRAIRSESTLLNTNIFTFLHPNHVHSDVSITRLFSILSLLYTLSAADVTLAPW